VTIQFFPSGDLKKILLTDFQGETYFLIKKIFFLGNVQYAEEK